MMPIVFCASLPPWPRLYRPAETSCRRRNRLSTLSGDARRKTLATSTIKRAPSRKPSTGEMKMKTTVFRIPPAISEPVPLLAITAPTMPPMRACDELDGMPHHQVTKFQAMAPISAPKTTWWSTASGCAMPLPTVAATLRWKMKIATTLKNAAKTIACCGFSTPVETTVAIEFAASWKPFMKSNSTASATSSATTPNEISVTVTGGDVSGVLEDDALDQIGDVLAAVGDRLEQLVDRAQLDQLA